MALNILEANVFTMAVELSAECPVDVTSVSFEMEDCCFLPNIAFIWRGKY